MGLLKAGLYGTLAYILASLIQQTLESYAASYKAIDSFRSYWSNTPTLMVGILLGLLAIW